jgi:TRAP-type C4-dicarboxylate transport system permease small subunit
MPFKPDRIPRPLSFLRDVIEIHIPSLAFVMMFVTFILQIFFRYVLRQPLQWAYEVTVTCYLWLVLLGACYAQRDHKHVVFTMLCDKLSVRPRALMMFLGNLLMLIAFAYAFLPSVEFVFFMGRQETAVFKIGLDVVYFAYIPFMIIMMVYMVRDMIAQFRVFSGIAGAEEVHAFDEATLEDYEKPAHNAANVIDMAKEDKA